MKQRLILYPIGGLLGLALVLALAFVWAQPAAVKSHPVFDFTHCIQSPQISVQWFCGKKVIWINPHGDRVVQGRTRDMGGIPRPRPVQAK